MRIVLGSSIAGLMLLSAGVLNAAPQQAAGQQPTASQPAAQKIIPVADFVRDDDFWDVKLSPSGKYIARSINIGEKTVLVIQQRSDGKITGHFNLAGKTQVQDFHWVNDERLVISVGEKFGLLERPQSTGELYATNADGSDQKMLIGARATDDDNEASPNITVGRATVADAAYWMASLRNDPRHVIVGVWPDGSGSVAFSKAASMDVKTGQIVVIANPPVRRATFTTDLQGGVRFAMGSGSDNRSKTYYRDNANSGWLLLNDQSVSNVNLTPLGFAADGHTAYLQREDTGKGPDTVVAYDTVNHSMHDVLHDAVADPATEETEAGVLRGPSGEVIGVRYLDAKPRNVFFDDNSAMAKLYRSLEASFPDQSVVITDYTSDGKLAVVFTYSDRSPGDYYLFDMENRRAAHLLSHRDWIDPDRMGIERPVTLKARDGESLHGFLTLPAGSDGKNLPMVVNPHGGPIGVADEWGFDGEVQLLASRGYAVLQVNFRGSAGFGRAFETAGFKQFGGTMQDDVTDATRWAIAQGIADPGRICIYGASYGGYAALMGVAKEPSLYRCAIGYVGIYEMPAMYTVGDIKDSPGALNEWKQWLGEDNLESISPTHLADRIKVPVMLAAGKEDERAPPVHTEKMRDALEHAGKSVDASIYVGEGHGFFVEADRESFYNHMLNFLDRYIGDHAAQPAVTSAQH